MTRPTHIGRATTKSILPPASLGKLHQRGFALVRLRPRTKEAFERGWNQLSRAPADFLPGENVGVRFGHDSGNLVDIDLDTPEARLLIGEPIFELNHLPEFGRASLPKGQRGHRLLISADSPGRSLVFGFRTDEDKAMLRTFGVERLTMLEVRASGQTAFPPSIITREVGGQVVTDRLVWSQPGACEVHIPEISWDDVRRRASLLAVSAFVAAVMRSISADPVARETARELFGDLLADAGIHDIEDIDAAVMRSIANEPPTRTTSTNDIRSLLGPQSRVGGTLLRWLGHEGDNKEGTGASGPDHGPIAAEDLETLLEVLDPCEFASYFAWRDLMFACHHATGGSDAGSVVFVEWSQGNPEFYGEHWAHEVRNAWRRCSTDRSATITLGTLLMHVDQAGHGALRKQVMSKYEPSPVNDFDNAPLDDYERIAGAPIVPFDDSTLNAPAIDSKDH